MEPLRGAQRPGDSKLIVHRVVGVRVNDDVYNLLCGELEGLCNFLVVIAISTSKSFLKQAADRFTVTAPQSPRR